MFFWILEKKMTELATISRGFTKSLTREVLNVSAVVSHVEPKNLTGYPIDSDLVLLINFYALI